MEKRKHILQKIIIWNFVLLSGFHGNAEEAPDLYCKSCASSNSLRHCILNQKEILCPKGKERCLEVEFYGDNGVGFVRDCEEVDLCFESKLPQCLDAHGNSSYCSLSCCETNLCNTAKPSFGTNLEIVCLTLVCLIMKLLF